MIVNNYPMREAKLSNKDCLDMLGIHMQHKPLDLYLTPSAKMN